MSSWSLVFHSCAALVLLPALALAAPAARPVKQYTIEQLLETSEVVGASFSPDEKRVLFSSNGTGVFNV
ncbi:peptidase, S9C (acylaminoacyl-peptidase) subfamily [Cystobacter fuscus DSM 2262]|uniref:Peptidase, S9C (Acylaminoacyl-peptidase) subfamily n=1 Tax=Cystobacter fuscus (strain ATCC 25194 / DSM 2262 / NBRC 100088 / M29) TaxID=1242864 RepID=S9PIU1_CYSF2|nr:hypothetical protein [Cystobacter fuscus]EPX62332.1 peptidase, S9C (acylaminoacyl-peptidase) subfamily [Cystobacter fuscus DSM 2262]